METKSAFPRKSRFLKRKATILETASSELEEKMQRLVDPADCAMWERHSRSYGLLTEESCRGLIDGTRGQGRQEVPAIVRKTVQGYMRSAARAATPQ